MTAMILTFHLSFFVCIRIIYIYTYTYTYNPYIYNYIYICIYIYTYHIYIHIIYIHMILSTRIVISITDDAGQCCHCYHCRRQTKVPLQPFRAISTPWSCQLGLFPTAHGLWDFGTLGLECLEKRRFQLQTLRFYGYLMLYPKSFSKSRGLPMVSFNVFAVLFCSKHPAAHGRW